MSLSAPYRFVPLSKLVLLPDWADQVSHDRPFEDGVSGELTITLRCDTPLCVGGEQDPSSDKAPGKVHFFRAPGGQDGQLAIPGTSLKGMLRNVLEIASFARFKQVADQKLGVRDLSTGVDFYKDLVTKRKIYAGWLSYQDAKWQVLPCEFSRLYQGDLINTLKANKTSWKNANTAVERYKLITTCPQIQFETTPMEYGDKLKAIPSPTGKHIGKVVVTGQPGKPYDAFFTNSEGKKINKNKKYEFVFHDSSEEPIEVTKETMTGFKQIHSESDEWKFWNEQQAAGNLDLGIPVFFHKSDTGSIKSMGLAMMYKLPYENSLHDAIRHTLADHLDSKQPDLPDLIFGFLGDDQNEGLRGRVNIGMALSDKANVATTWKGPMILNSPKPSYYPFYIRQNGRNGQPRQLMEAASEVSGWKRYPAKNVPLQPIPEELKSKTELQVSLETLPEGTEFSFKIRIHNLRRAELGALLWTLDFGGKFECRHGLGIGRPFGFGQIALSITDSKLRANKHNPACQQQPEVYLTVCRMEFEQMMDKFLRQSGNSWNDCKPVKELQNLATPKNSKMNAELLQYMELKDFPDGKKAANLGEVTELFHSTKPVTPPADYYHSQTIAFENPDFDADFAEAEQIANEQRALAAEEEDKRRKKADLEETLANASAEDQILIKISNLTNIYRSDACTKTTKDNLASEFNNAHKQQSFLTDEQQIRVRAMTDTINEDPSSKLGKAIKKIKRDFPA